MATITVTGKANLGYSPKFGDIKKGQEYTIEETDFAPELFHAPSGLNTKQSKPKSTKPKTKKAPPLTVVDKPVKTDTGANQTNQEVLP